MCFKKIKINGEKYSLCQAQAIFDKMSQEISRLTYEKDSYRTSLEESLEREAIAKKLYEQEKEKVTKKNIEIRLLKEQLPTRDDKGRYTAKPKNE